MTSGDAQTSQRARGSGRQQGQRSDGSGVGDGSGSQDGDYTTVPKNVGLARDEVGNVVEKPLDEEGNIVGDAAEGEDATTAAREKARALGVDLGGLRGTGSGGRILVRDVERAARDSVEATPAAREKARALGVDLLEVTGSGSGGRITVRDVVRASGEG